MKEGGTPPRERKSARDERFDFDAPKIRDFTQEGYQKEKRRIERLLTEFGRPGEPQDPSKTKKEKKPEIVEAGPRKTFFSHYFKDPPKKAPALPPQDSFCHSVDDKWFEKQEQNELEQHEDTGAYIESNALNEELFASDEEAAILPRLKVISTPPIRPVQKNLSSIEFSASEVQELSRSLAQSLNDLGSPPNPLDTDSGSGPGPG
ncbi:hypothetical protein NEDG_00722 [Nematocida displodere]|uniref:Uncharacterized protein n=1 Tax=Nematocida displodere TaxID=1805483 RepID=A0A177EF22_9MICR|nr:hypothetical protein NEDG_00722 [Nematocida displodere]